MTNKLLTKSKYLQGIQCQKLLWISTNDKKRIPEPDDSAKAKFKAGEILGILATKNFPDGISLANLDFKENLEQTKELISRRIPIFEAGFIENNLYSRADILNPVNENEWDIIEVKSSTKVKDINLHDLAFQKYTYQLAGIQIRNCYLMHINNQYQKQGDIDPKQLFTKENVTEQVEVYSTDIEDKIKQFKEIINSNEPEIDIGPYCQDPYECPMKRECWQKIPEHSIFTFSRMFTKKMFELYTQGIINLSDVPETTKLNEKQSIQRKLSIYGGIHMNKEKIKNFLDKLEYPIYYLDFETINPAVPKFDGMKPYQRIPFQYSLHIQEEKKSSPKHISFLHEGQSDPRKNFMQSLKENLNNKGSILVYNQGFEKGVMRESSESFQEFKEWFEQNIQPRIKDLWDIFKDFHYYNPKQKGSTSIKYTLPTLSNLSYSKMDIRNGSMASQEYERVTYSEVEEEDKAKVRKDLERYCELDTYAEVEIIKALQKILEE